MDTTDDIDRVLASLEYDGVFWRGTVSAKYWPEPIELEFSGESGGPTEHQVEVLREVLAHNQDLKQV